jgi:hypothetical protein
MYHSDKKLFISDSKIRFSTITRRWVVQRAIPPARMTRGHRISEDLRQVVVRMRRALPIHEIMRYTGVTRRTIERILSTYQSGGRGALGLVKPKAGRNRILTDADFKVGPM